MFGDNLFHFHTTAKKLITTSMLAVQVVDWDEVLSAPIDTVLGHVQTKTIKHSSVRVALLILAPVFCF